jgi:hypothetical protein
MQQDEDIIDLVDFHTSNIVPSFAFIDLFGFSSKKGSPSLVESSITQLRPSLYAHLEVVFYQLTSEPSTLILSIQSIIDYLCAMSITIHASNELRNLDHDKIIIIVVSFLPTTFNNDILFESPRLFLVIIFAANARHGQKV